MSGFGRLAVEPRTQTSRKGDDYTFLRVAQNVRLVGARIVTNHFDLVCFGGAHEIAKRLATGQEVYFRGTFGVGTAGTARVSAARTQQGHR